MVAHPERPHDVPTGDEGDLVKMALELLAYPAKPESYGKVA